MIKGGRVYDISIPIEEGIAVWPGDPPFLLSRTSTVGPDAPATVHQFRMGTHTGTHIDAPAHVLSGGATLHEYPAETFIGPALVLDALGHRLIPPELLAEVPTQKYTAVLFKSRAAERNPAVFDANYSALAPATMQRLIQLGVKIVGLDAASIDPFDSTDLPAHHLGAAAGILNLENLNLAAVPAGEYVLIALPLKMVNVEAAPARALLLGS